MPAYETEPASAPPRLMLPASVCAAARFVAFALTSTDEPPVMSPFMFASTFPFSSAIETKNVPAASTPAVPPRAVPLATLPSLRVFASTVINYLYRQTLSVLGPYLKTDYSWTNEDFALIVKYR